MAKQFDEYNLKKSKVVNLLNECAARITNDKIKKKIAENERKVREEQFVVSVFGHFSNGKSTFLNSLMGFEHEVLKEDDNASTATITRLRFAELSDKKCNQIDVIFRDGSVERIPMDDLPKYVARNNEVDVEHIISEVILYVNSPFLKNGVEIVDTPGFNSTYEIHSEIALQQVEKSDAAIFLFSVDQPGNGEEFDFLRKVSGYMERVFFVLNKVDKSDDNGVTEKNDIFSKMNRIGIPTENKRMYVLSALRAREALEKNDREILKASGLMIFENALVQYLTSEQFIKDRLFAPLSSVFKSLEQEIELITDQIGACSKERNELNSEIQTRKKALREKETELAGARRIIASAVKLEILSAKTDVKAAVTKVSNLQTERLSKIKSKFDIRLASFEDLNRETYVLFHSEWENIAEHFEKRLMDVLDTSIDSEEEFYEIYDAIAVAIRSHLLLEEICIDNPDFDFSELSKIDEEISKAKEEYEKAYNKVSNLYALKDNKNDALTEIERIEKELERLRNKKEKRIESLSMVQIEYGYEMQRYDAYVKRSKIGQFFLGDKRVERERRVEYKDSRAYDAAVAEIARVEKELEQGSRVRKEQVKKIKESIDSAEFKQIDREIARAEIEEQASLDELMRRRESQREEKRVMEMEIITIEKDKYLRELKKTLDDMGKRIISFLEQSQKNFVSILSSCLEQKYEAIEREKSSIEKIASINDHSPEDLEKLIAEFNSEKLTLSSCMKKIDETKEAIKNAD